MIDDDNHSARLLAQGCRHTLRSAFEKTPQLRYFLNPELGGFRPLEDLSVSADDERTLDAGARHHLS